MDLTRRTCLPCEGKAQMLNQKEIQEYMSQTSGWQLNSDGKAIFKDFVMKNFVTAVDLIRHIAVVAENENHHPDIHLTAYRKLKVVLTTHALGGLSENDFILAAKINALPCQLKQTT